MCRKKKFTLYITITKYFAFQDIDYGSNYVLYLIIWIQK